MNRSLVALGLALLVVGFATLMVFSSFTDSLLFYPERGQWRTPEAFGLAFEEVWLDAGDYRVESWWLPGSSDRPAPGIVMFHGNGGTIADRLENVSQLISRFGTPVFQVEYPGYGNSGGRPSEESLYLAGRLALEEARRRLPLRPIVVFGRSLGGAVAIELAARYPVEGLVAESTFTSLPDMAAGSGIPFARRLVSYQFDSLSKMDSVESPVLLIHGDRDEIVPYPMSRRLQEAAPEAGLHTVAGGAHNDTWLVGGEGYWQAWAEFLDLVGESASTRTIADSPEP